MPRLVLIDPAVRNRTGHHYNFNYSLIEQWQARGLPFVTLAGRLYEAPVGRELGIQPVFQANQYDALTAASALNLSRKAAHELLAKVLFKDLADHSELLGQPGDVVVFQINNAGMFLAAAHWLQDFHATWDGPVVLYFMGVDFVEGPDQHWSELAEVYRTGLHLLTLIPPSRLRLIAEHQEIADQLESLSHHTVSITEAPHFRSKTQMARLMAVATKPEPPKGQVRIGFLGHARQARGAHLIPGIVRATGQAAGARATFVVHMDLRGWNGKQTHPNLREDLMELTDSGIQRLYLGDMSMDAYYDFFATIDLMLFPYSDLYALSGSGIYFEALACGMPMVVPSHSFMRRHLEGLGGGFVPFETLDEPSIAAALVAAVDAFPALRAKALHVGPAWQQAHDMSAFAASLLR